MRTLREFRQILRQAKEDHDLRHRPSRFRAALFDSISYVPVDAWNAVVPEPRLFMRHPYLLALEQSGASDLQHRYALLYDGDRPVAAVAMKILEFSSEALGTKQASGQKEKLRVRVGKALRTATEGIALRVLVCGNAFVTGEHGFCHVPDLDPVEAYDGLAEVLYRVRRADKLHGQVSGVLVKDFYDDLTTEHARELLRFGYREFSVDPQMVVCIRPEWSSFEDYVAALTKKYRARARSVRKKGKHVERRALDADDIRRRHAEIRALFTAVHEKARFRVAALPEHYFASLARHLGDQFSMHGYFLADQLVGFASSIHWGDRMESHYLGLDYEHNIANGVYQNILYDGILEAIERGSRELNLGRTALEIKSGIGAKPRPVSCFMRHRNPASNAIVRPLFGFAKSTTWTPRSPFASE